MFHEQEVMMQKRSNAITRTTTVYFSYISSKHFYDVWPSLYAGRLFQISNCCFNCDLIAGKCIRQSRWM